MKTKLVCEEYFDRPLLSRNLFKTNENSKSNGWANCMVKISLYVVETKLI